MKDSIKKWIPIWGFYAALWSENRWPWRLQGFIIGFLAYWLISILFLTGCSAQGIGYIDCSPFPSKCLIVSGKDYRQTQDWLQRDTLWRDSLWYIESDFNCNYSFTNYIDPPDDWPVFIIVFNQAPTDDLDGYLLVGHEVIHLMQFLCEAYHVDFTIEKESTAYLFEHLVTETYKIVKQ